MSATTLLLNTERDQIRTKWEKTSAEVQEYITIIKDWAREQKHLPEIPNDNMIEFILTNCKYSIEKAKHNLDMYYTIRTIMPDFFRNCHPLKSTSQKHVTEKMGYYVPMPKLLRSLYRLTILAFIEGDGEAYDQYHYFSYGMNIFEIRLHEDLTLGEIMLFDFQNMTMSHALKFSPAFFKKVTVMLQEIFNNRVLEIHIINYPSYLDKVLSIAKLFLKKKLYERIHLHQNIERLFEHIPPENLPSDYGGNEKSLKELTDLWQLKFKEYEKRFDFLETMQVNEALRPEPLENSEVLGYYGNFKKIDVD